MGAPQMAEGFDFPKVSGRHHNRPLASRRRAAAVQLVSRGLTYQETADRLGYRNKGTVHHIVRTALKVDETTSVQQYRQQAYERLEGLLRAVWDSAVGGDLPAVAVALRIVQAECRLLDLYPGPASTDPRRDWPCCQGPATVVIRPDDCRHVGCELHGKFATA